MIQSSRDSEEETKVIDECKDTIAAVSLKNNLISRILIDSKNDYFNKTMISFNSKKNDNDHGYTDKLFITNQPGLQYSMNITQHSEEDQGIDDIGLKTVVSPQYLSNNATKQLLSSFNTSNNTTLANNGDKINTKMKISPENIEPNSVIGNMIENTKTFFGRFIKKEPKPKLSIIIKKSPKSLQINTMDVSTHKHQPKDLVTRNNQKQDFENLKPIDNLSSPNKKSSNNNSISVAEKSEKFNFSTSKDHSIDFICESLKDSENLNLSGIKLKY